MKGGFVLLLLTLVNAAFAQTSPGPQPKLIACDQIRQVLVVSDKEKADSFSVQHQLLDEEEPAEFSVQVFDRWGKEIFAAKNWRASWYGYRDQKRLAEPGIYPYLISVTDKGGRTETCKGVVTVIHK